MNSFRTFVVALVSVVVFLTTTNAGALGSIPSPTDVLEPANAEAVYKVHHWNALNVDKVRDVNDEYNVRTDFNLDIANDAWQNEKITALSLNEICKSSVDELAVASGIDTANYEFMDYQGRTSSYVIDNAACARSSGQNNDKFGQAILLRGAPIEKQTFRNTGVAAGAGGNRGLSCVKTTLAGKVLASCTMHTAFDVSTADDRFEITRQQVRQNETNARAFAEGGTVADHLFLPGDYNLSTYEANNRGVNPQPASANNPDIVLSDYFHGFNTQFTFPSLSPNRRLDYIYADKSLQYTENTTAVCTGPGMADEDSLGTQNYTGDHCYIGAIFYKAGATSATSPGVGQPVPGVPNAGNRLSRNSYIALIAGAGLMSTSIIAWRIKQRS